MAVLIKCNLKHPNTLSAVRARTILDRSANRITGSNSASNTVVCMS